VSAAKKSANAASAFSRQNAAGQGLNWSGFFDFLDLGIDHIVVLRFVLACI
jgi:hypothetical protein